MNLHELYKKIQKNRFTVIDNPLINNDINLSKYIIIKQCCDKSFQKSIFPVDRLINTNLQICLQTKC